MKTKLAKKDWDFIRANLHSLTVPEMAVELDCDVSLVQGAVAELMPPPPKTLMETGKITAMTAAQSMLDDENNPMMEKKEGAKPAAPPKRKNIHIIDPSKPIQ